MIVWRSRGVGVGRWTCLPLHSVFRTWGSFQKSSFACRWDLDQCQAARTARRGCRWSKRRTGDQLSRLRPAEAATLTLQGASHRQGRPSCRVDFTTVRSAVQTPKPSPGSDQIYTFSAPANHCIISRSSLATSAPFPDIDDASPLHKALHRSSASKSRWLLHVSSHFPSPPPLFPTLSQALLDTGSTSRPYARAATLRLCDAVTD